jgi:4-amino-4-deoxy-L-arabinose transferase-like glycosyltransferase
MSKFHSWDEWVYLQNAQVICCNKNNYSELAFRPPLLSLLFAGVFWFKHSIYAACIATALLNALAPVFLFLAGRLTVGRIAACIASLLLAFSPFFLSIFPPGFDSDGTGNSLMSDSPALTLITLSFWLLLLAVQRPSFLRFFLAGFTLALCILMRFGSMTCVGMLLPLTLLSQQKVRSASATLIGLATGLAPYFIWSQQTFGDPFFTIKAGWVHVEGDTDPFTFYLRNAVIIFTPLALAGLLLFVVWLLFGPLLKRRGYLGTPQAETVPRHRILQAYLLAWLLIAFLAYSLIQHKEPRYILPATPSLLLLSGAGLSLFTALPRQTGRRLAASVLGLCLLATFLPVRHIFAEPFLNRQIPDEEQAAHVLAAQVPPGTRLYMSYNYPALAYFTNFHIHELSHTGPELYTDMNAVPPGEVLVVYRQAEAPAQSDVAWCDANPGFQQIAAYPTLVIYQRLPAGRFSARNQKAFLQRP